MLHNDYKEYYKTLGVNTDATTDEIRNAYRKLALKLHPDKNPDAESTAKFQALSTAYDILSDQEKRCEYDDDCQPLLSMCVDYFFQILNLDTCFLLLTRLVDIYLKILIECFDCITGQERNIGGTPPYASFFSTTPSISNEESLTHDQLLSSYHP